MDDNENLAVIVDADGIIAEIVDIVDETTCFT